MLCEENKCTGCFACKNICPKNCIELIPNEKGHVLPKINSELCIKCGLCSRVCPSLDDINLTPPITAFAAWALNEDERLSSTSGGVAAVFSRYVLRKGGVVFGAAIQENLSVKHIMIEKEKDLYKLKGSKYVHSFINDCYTIAKEKLEKDVLVLFTGTPCQIAGLKKFLKKDFKNLITIDIICHGVPSQKMLLEEVDNENADSFSFRDNKGYNMTFYKKDKTVKKIPMPKSPYFFSFMKSITCRESCYSCQYANKNRISDITIGDFWGLGVLKNETKEEDKGISVLLPITNKGLNLINECKNMLFLEERTVDEAVNGNGQLKHPSSTSKGKEIFNNLYPTMSFEKSVKKATKYYSLKNTVVRLIYSEPNLLNNLRKLKRKLKK